MNPLIAYVESHSFNFAWGCFLFPGLLIAIIVLAVRARKKHGLALAIALPAVVIFLAAAALFTVRGSRQVSYSERFDDVGTLDMPATVVTPASPTEAVVSGSANDSLPLAETPSDAVAPALDLSGEIYANAYPSERSAANAVTRRVLLALDKAVPVGVTLDSLAITQGTPEIRALVAAAAKAVLPNVTIITDEPTPAAKDGETRVTLKLDTPSFRPGESQITITLFGPAGSLYQVEQARAITKPWVEGQDKLPADPAFRRFVIHSDLTSDPATASSQALDRAVDHFRVLAESRLARAGRTSLSDSDRHWLTGAIRDDINSKNLIVDRFDQQIDRPYARLWRQSLLVSIPDTDFTYMVSEYRRQIDQHRTGVRNNLLMAGGLALGIIVLYLFLNAATKGYYMWPLRLFGIVAVVAGVALVLNLA